MADICVLRPRNLGVFAHTITQEDLLDLVRRSQEFTSAREAYEKQRDYIKAALDSGARIEDGALDASIVTSELGQRIMPGCKIRKVVVRGRRAG